MTGAASICALLFGGVAATALPLGACFGKSSASSDRVIARGMAVGAGALVFASAAQFFGDALYNFAAAMDPRFPKAGVPEPEVKAELDRRFLNLMVQGITGFAGAGVYYILNLWLRLMAARRGGLVSPELQDTEAARDTWQGPGTWAGAGESTTSVDNPYGAQPSFSSSRTTLTELIFGGDSNSLGGWTSSHSSYLAPGVTEGLRAPQGLRAPLSHHKSRVSATDLRAISEEEYSKDGESKPDVALLCLWLGMALDGIPGALMIGLMIGQGVLTWQFVAALWIANFFEASSAGRLLRDLKVRRARICGTWAFAVASRVIISICGSQLGPFYEDRETASRSPLRTTQTAAVVGLTTGALLAMIARAMIHDSFRSSTGELPGMLYVMSFMGSGLLMSLELHSGRPSDFLYDFLHNFMYSGNMIP